MKKSIIASIIGAVIGLFALSVSAVDVTKGSAGGSYAVRDTAYVFAPQNVLDLSTVTVDSNDVVSVLHISEGSLVHAIKWSVQTAVTPTNGVTFSVTDSSGTTWISGADAATVGSGSSGLAVTGPQSTNLTISGAAKYFASNGTLRIQFGLDPGTVGKIQIQPLVSYVPARQ